MIVGNVCSISFLPSFKKRVHSMIILQVFYLNECIAIVIVSGLVCVISCRTRCPAGVGVLQSVTSIMCVPKQSMPPYSAVHQQKYPDPKMVDAHSLLQGRTFLLLYQSAVVLWAWHFSRSC